MKVVYSKKLLKAAARYIAANNPGMPNDWQVVYKDAKKRMMRDVTSNAKYVEKGCGDWVRYTSTGGIILLYSEDGEYIDVDVYVTPRFGDCKFIEKEL